MGQPFRGLGPAAFLLLALACAHAAKVASKQKDVATSDGLPGLLVDSEEDPEQAVLWMCVAVREPSSARDVGPQRASDVQQSMESLRRLPGVEVRHGGRCWQWQFCHHHGFLSLVGERTPGPVLLE